MLKEYIPFKCGLCRLFNLFGDSRYKESERVVFAQLLVNFRMRIQKEFYVFGNRN
jgi:hypothetical protein